LLICQHLFLQRMAGNVTCCRHNTVIKKIKKAPALKPFNQDAKMRVFYIIDKKSGAAGFGWVGTGVPFYTAAPACCCAVLDIGCVTL
jgi:hypothetical protein